MAYQFSTTARNASLDAIETAIGVSAILRLRSGAAPAVILPVLTGRDRRTHAAIFSFMAGVTPPMPMFGRSLL
jgi:hypothetical protein